MPSAAAYGGLDAQQAPAPEDDVDLGAPPGRGSVRADGVAELTDPSHGPLVGRAIGRRVLPFAAVGALIMAFTNLGGLPLWILALSGALLVVLVGGAMWLPWARWPVGSQASVPLLGLGVLLLLHVAEHPRMGFISVISLPIVWLALYHHVAWVVAGLVELTAGIAIVEAAVLGSGSPDHWRSVVLSVAATALIGLTVHGLVATVRRGTAGAAEASRRAVAERNYATGILQGAAALVCVLDRRGRVEFVNRHCEAVLGYPAASVTGRSVWRAGLRPAHPGELRQLVARLVDGEPAVSYEDEWTTAAGQPRRLSWTVAALRDADGAIAQFVATGHDVTSQRQTERLFRHVRSAATHYALFAVDTDGIFTVFNAGAERLFGRSAEAVIGTSNIAILFPPPEPTDQAAALPSPGSSIMASIRADAPYTHEETLVRADGHTFPAALTLSVIMDERGQLMGYLGSVRDITVERQATAATIEALYRERQASARLRDLSERQTSFVTTVSHELRTPLTSIVGNIELLLSEDVGPLTSRQQRVLATAERNANRLTALVTNLLTVSKLESEVFGARRVVDLRAVVTQALEALADNRSTHRVSLDVDLPDEPAEVIGDEHALDLVVTNLLGNAHKFTPDGGRIEVRVTATATAVTLTIKDTGLGIPEADLPHVFDRFYRSSMSRQHEIQGTGLGLAIARSIIEQHNGLITLASAPGEGTTATVVLLCAPVPASEPQPATGGIATR
jgi:PAS domain S-box-containing protein